MVGGVVTRLADLERGPDCPLGMGDPPLAVHEGRDGRQVVIGDLAAEGEVADLAQRPVGRRCWRRRSRASYASSSAGVPAGGVAARESAMSAWKLSKVRVVRPRPSRSVKPPMIQRALVSRFAVKSGSPAPLATVIVCRQPDPST